MSLANLRLSHDPSLTGLELLSVRTNDVFPRGHRRFCGTSSQICRSGGDPSRLSSPLMKHHRECIKLSLHKIWKIIWTRRDVMQVLMPHD